MSAVKRFITLAQGHNITKFYTLRFSFGGKLFDIASQVCAGM